MNIAARIKEKLVGPENSKQRRTQLLVHLDEAFSQNGPQAVTDDMTQRIDELVDAFSDQLQDLKKQI